VAGMGLASHPYHQTHHLLQGHTALIQDRWTTPDHRLDPPEAPTIEREDQTLAIKHSPSTPPHLRPMSTPFSPCPLVQNFPSPV
jgi:hypothetical protein